MKNKRGHRFAAAALLVSAAVQAAPAWPQEFGASVREALSAARESRSPDAPSAAAPAEAAAAPPVPEFCRDPSRFVCSGVSETSRARAVAAEQGHLRGKTIESTLEYVGIPRSRWSEFADEADLAAKLPSEDRVKAARFYYKQLREYLRDYLAQNDLPADYGMTQLRANMKEAIAAASDFAPAQRETMARIVDDTRLLTIADYASDVELRGGDLAALWRGCGGNDLLDDAFSTELRRRRVIVICPGYLIGSIQNAKLLGLPHELILSAMTETLAHEIGHQFDSRMPGFKESYASTLNVLERNASRLSPGTPADKYMSESTADLWGNRTLAVALPAISDPGVRAKVLKANFADLCFGYADGGDDKVHPSNDFRMDVLAAAVLCR